MKDTGKINETDVETSLELARQWDEEGWRMCWDMTQPLFRQKQDGDIKAFKEREKEPVIDFEDFITSMDRGKEKNDDE